MELQNNNNILLKNSYTPPYIYPYDYQIYYTGDTSNDIYKHHFNPVDHSLIDFSQIYIPSPPISPINHYHSIVKENNPILKVDTSKTNSIGFSNTLRTKSVIMKVSDFVSGVTEVKSTSPVNSVENNNENFVCNWLECWKTFETLEALAAHVSQIHAVPSPEGLYFCKWFGCIRMERGFNARYKMLVHVRTHTKEKPHKCNLCEKKFSRAENLKIHIRSHSGEKPYVCTFEGCNKAYSNSSDRFKHTRTHSTDKPYVCKIIGCQKRYTDPSSLRKHVKTFKHNIICETKETKLFNNLQELRLSPESSSEGNDNKQSILRVACHENLSQDYIITNGKEINLNSYTKYHSADLDHNFNGSIYHNFETSFSELTTFSKKPQSHESIELDIPLDLSIHNK